MNFIIHFLKGVAMGAANVIPGVSGGTIALITGIFERIIHAIKNTFSLQSFKLFFSGKFKQWAQHTDFVFVVALGAGVVLAMVSIGKILGYLFENFPVYVWAFFFGLVFASVWFVARTVKKFGATAIIFFIIGAAIALSMALLKPMGENRDIMYLIFCGVIAACSMILPGLSGSFVLVLMGNYELVMIHAINDADFSILLPVVVGAGAGLLVFSYMLAWIFKKFKDQTISLLSGFMLGSLLIIWPWKVAIMKQGSDGNAMLNRSGDMIVEKYIWTFPQQLDSSVAIAIAFIVAGMAVIVFTETIAAKKNKKSIPEK